MANRISFYVFENVEDDDVVTESIEDVRTGGYFFEVGADGRTYEVLVTEITGGDE